MHRRDLGFEKAGRQALTEPWFKAVDAIFGETAARIADGLFPGGQPLLGAGGQRWGARTIGFPRHRMLSGRPRHRRLAFQGRVVHAAGVVSALPIPVRQVARDLIEPSLEHFTVCPGLWGHLDGQGLLDLRIKGQMDLTPRPPLPAPCRRTFHSPSPSIFNPVESTPT